MPALTAIYLDFQSPASYRAWRWLSLLPERATVDVRPYSTDPENGVRRNPWDRTKSSAGLELLALGEFARGAGRETHLRFVDAAFAAVHDQGADLSSMEGWLEIGAEAGLDLQRYSSDSDRWRAEVGLWHQEAEDELNISRVPSLVFDERHALFVKLDKDLSDVTAARRLLADLADLAALPVDEVRRTA